MISAKWNMAIGPAIMVIGAFGAVVAATVVTEVKVCFHLMLPLHFCRLFMGSLYIRHMLLSFTVFIRSLIGVLGVFVGGECSRMANVVDLLWYFSSSVLVVTTDVLLISISHPQD
jgi:hypothetical protein